jgi:hypothetical protein
VDLDDDTYHIPDFSDLSPLVKSVRAIGIVNPPLLQERADGRMIPALGRKRLKAAAEAGIDRTKAGILPAEMPRSDGFKLAFWDNIHRKSSNPASTAVLVKTLLEVFPRQVVADEFLPVLGVQPSGPRLERLKKMGGLEPSVLSALACGKLQERTAVILAELTPHERLTLMEFTERLGLNANKKAEVIGHLFDLSIVNSRSVLECLSDERVIQIVENSDAPLPERANRFRRFVRFLRFPELALREEEFNRWLGSVRPSNNVSVSPAPFFESGGYTVEARAASLEEAERILRRLQETPTHEIPHRTNLD